MKLKKLFLFLASMAFSYGAVAQDSASIQIIHNSADPAASSVDVYVFKTQAGSKIADDLSFRKSTGFTKLPLTGGNLKIGIAPGNSSTANDTLKSFTLSLQDGGKYVAVANGVLPTSSGFNPKKELDLNVKSMARESSSGSGETDVLVHHGSTDAPNVDVEEIGQGAGQIVSNLAYGNFTNYLTLNTADYQLEVRPNGSSSVVGRYRAPLSTLNLGGKAITVFASGFLNPGNNNDGPSFGLYAALPSGIVQKLPEINQAQVQLIHNSADVKADTVDVYLNGRNVINDLEFRDATEFLTVPAKQDITVSIGPWNKALSDTIFRTTVKLNANTKYIAVANGTFSGGYSPSKEFGLSIKAMARESANNSGKTDALVHHGSTDAPAVDIVETQQGAGTLVDSITYGDFAGYLSVNPANYTIEVQANANNNTVATFEAPLANLGLMDSALTVFASGFLNPANNNDGAAFGLYAALANGNVVPLNKVESANVQLIHNVADPAADTVDVYVNGSLQFEDFSFREATSFVELPANEQVNVGIAPVNTSVDDTLKNFSLNLNSNTNYVAVANGIVSNSGFDPNRAFELSIFSGASTSANSNNNTAILIHHGSTDAPQVDVDETEVTNQNLVSDLAYGTFANQYLNLGTQNYTVQVNQSSDGSKVASFEANLDDLGLSGEAIVLFASGFLNPANNSDGPGLGLYAATTTGNIVELSQTTGLVDRENQIDLQTYPNPASDEVRVAFGENDFEQARIDVLNMKGQVVNTKRTAAQGNAQLNLSGLSNGNYLLRISADGETVATQQIVKQ